MSIQTHEIRRARPLLGTFVEITTVDAPDADVAIEAAFDAIARVHRLMSFHEPTSDVSRLNREAFKRPVVVHPWTYQVLKASIDLYQQTGGLFNVAIAPILQSLKLLPLTSDGMMSHAKLGPNPIVLLPDYQVRFSDPAVSIDLGGIAKGFAVDQAVALLRWYEISAGLVNAGGDMASFGPIVWTAYIRHPRYLSQLMAQVELHHEALASSGNHFDPWPLEDRAQAATIDPRSQQPAVGAIGASVCASSCMIADALTKFVIIAGELSASLLDKYQAKALLIQENGKICMTSNWQKENILCTNVLSGF